MTNVFVISARGHVTGLLRYVFNCHVKSIATFLGHNNWVFTIRALPDITSGPEVRQIFKVWTVRKPDVFLPGCRTLKNRKKKSRLKKKKLENSNILVVPMSRTSYKFPTSWIRPLYFMQTLERCLTHSIWQIQLWCPRSKWNIGEILAFLA